VCALDASAVEDRRLSRWADRILSQVNALAKSPEEHSALARRYVRFCEEELDPVLRILSGDPRQEKAAECLKILRDKLDGLFLVEHRTSESRQGALQEVFWAAVELQNALRPAAQPPARARLRDLAWRMEMDERGRAIFNVGGGFRLPLSSDVWQLFTPDVIAQVIRQQPTYPEAMRPLNVRQMPGALIRIARASRLLVVGDLHGRYDNLELVLADKENWRALREGSTHLVFLGDAIHPPSAREDQESANADALRVLLLILTLRAECPGNVHYLLGNHENAHVGGHGAEKGNVDVGRGFADFIRRNVGDVVLEAYETFLHDAPIAALFDARNGRILLTHACPSPRVLNTDGLVNLTVRGRNSRALTDILWNRDLKVRALRACLKNLDVNLAVCGHMKPEVASQGKYGYRCILEPVFGRVRNLLLIVNSQHNTFGYLDIDLTRDLPDSIEDLKAPDGKSAYRALRRTGVRPSSAD